MNRNCLFTLPLRLTRFIFCIAVLGGCENDQKAIDDITKPNPIIEEAKDIESSLSEGGSVKGKLWAPYMLRVSNDTSYVEFPKTLHVDFFDSTGKKESHLDALYGKYYETLNKLYLRDSVLVYNMKGDTLRSPDLWWDQNKQMFYTDKNVWLTQDGTILYGKGMDASQDLSYVHIFVDNSKLSPGSIELPDSLSVQ